MHNSEDQLAAMLHAQRTLQVESFGFDPAEEVDPAKRLEFLRWNVLALIAELTELLDETGWKPWATSQHINELETLGEWVDAWHFMMNVAWATFGQGVLGDADVLSELITAAYKRKHEVNAARQRDGYDGVSTKCPRCKRELSESICWTARQNGRVYGHCVDTGSYDVASS